MCKAPKVPKPANTAENNESKPEYLRNPYLDAAGSGASAIDRIRTGRNDLRQDLGSNAGLGIASMADTITGTQSRATPTGPLGPSLYDLSLIHI